MNKIVALVCLLIYILVVIWSSINPTDPAVWQIEVLTSAISVIILIILYFRGIRFSSLGYILMAIFPIMHAIGAHYTFSNVPSEWLSNLLGTDRNMYDRLAHAMVGLYAFGIIEYLDLKNLTLSKGLKISYAIFAIMALALTYELFEWRYAISSDPAAGLAVLGSQGDIRDAQKDMLMDTIGAVIGAIIYIFSFGKNNYDNRTGDKIGL